MASQLLLTSVEQDIQDTSDQQKDDLNPHAELGIVVGYESSNPSNLKVYIPSRQQIVIRSHCRDMPTTTELSDILSQQSLRNSSDDEYIYESDEDVNDLDSDDDIEAEASVMSYVVDSSTDDGCNQSSYNISIPEAYAQLDADEVESSILTEFANMEKFHVWDYVKDSDVPVRHKKLIIPSKMFLKKKYDASGMYLKLKSRLVAGGHRQHEATFSATSSPTVDISSVFLSLGISTYLPGCTIHNTDIPAAYLHCLLNDTIFMRLPKSLACILVKHKPHLKEYVTSNGSIVVKLLRSLYGLKQSSAEWYAEICSTLTSQAMYTVSSVDNCLLFKRDESDNLSIITIHVDDILLVTQAEAEVRFLSTILKNRYGDLEFSSDNLSYLGMEISRVRDGSILVTQTGYADKILERCDYTTTHVTPSKSDLFDSVDSPDIDNSHRSAEYKSLLMSLMFLAIRTRPDILKEVVLCRHSHSIPARLLFTSSIVFLAISVKLLILEEGSSSLILLS
jgi:hypothetical protein